MNENEGCHGKWRAPGSGWKTRREWRWRLSENGPWPWPMSHDIRYATLRNRIEQNTVLSRHCHIKCSAVNRRLYGVHWRMDKTRASPLISEGRISRPTPKIENVTVWENARWFHIWVSFLNFWLHIAVLHAFFYKILLVISLNNCRNCFWKTKDIWSDVKIAVQIVMLNGQTWVQQQNGLHRTHLLYKNVW